MIINLNVLFLSVMKMPVGMDSDINTVLRHLHIMTLPFQCLPQGAFIVFVEELLAKLVIGLFTVKITGFLKLNADIQHYKHASGSRELQQLASDQLTIVPLYFEKLCSILLSVTLKQKIVAPILTLERRHVAT